MHVGVSSCNTLAPIPVWVFLTITHILGMLSVHSILIFALPRLPCLSVVDRCIQHTGLIEPRINHEQQFLLNV